MSGATFPWADLSGVRGVYKEEKGLYPGGNGTRTFSPSYWEHYALYLMASKESGRLHGAQHSTLGSGAHF